MSTFDQIFAIVVGEEGGLSTVAADPGNWTGGSCGKGVCRGTKYGIAAAAHPQTDIPNLTLAEAKELYRSDYWASIDGDALPGPLALLVFDAAVNCGVRRAVTWLQAIVACTPDGVMGPATLQALGRHPGAGADLCAEFNARRLSWMTTLPTWPAFALGWSRRLCRLPFHAITIGEA